MAKLDITTLISQHSDILTSLFHHMSDMFFLMAVEKNAGGAYQFRYVLMNPAAMKGSGLTEDCYGKLIEEVYPQEKADLLNSMYSQTVEGASPTHFTTNGHMVGESILSPVFNNEGLCTHVFSVTRDITERKKLEWQLEHMAYHDMLTGLPNRRLLYNNLQEALERAEASGEMVAALYIDCDHFKQINDTWGHDIGDVFLQMLAKRLKSCVRDQDTVARLGETSLSSFSQPSTANVRPKKWRRASCVRSSSRGATRTRRFTLPPVSELLFSLPLRKKRTSC